MFISMTVPVYDVVGLEDFILSVNLMVTYSLFFILMIMLKFGSSKEITWCLISHASNIWCFTGQWFKVLLPEKWSSFIRDGSSQLDTLRSDEERLYSTNNTWNCTVLCCWKMWVPTSCEKYPGLCLCIS